MAQQLNNLAVAFGPTQSSCKKSNCGNDSKLLESRPEWNTSSMKIPNAYKRPNYPHEDASALMRVRSQQSLCNSPTKVKPRSELLRHSSPQQSGGTGLLVPCHICRRPN